MMSSPQAPVEDRLYVLFLEALSWIAFGDFSGLRSLGPRLLSEDAFDEAELTADMDSKLDLAVSLLLDQAARGKIRIYSRQNCILKKDSEIVGYAVLDPVFIAR